MAFIPIMYITRNFLLQAIYTTFFVNIFTFKIQTNGQIINTTTGLLRGFTQEFKSGFSVTKYLGIPFAEAPVGDLRFEESVDKKPWTGLYEALEFKPACLQDYESLETVVPRIIFEGSISEIIYGEDCLYLNIFVSNKPNIFHGRGKGKPVMVYIHGWDFQTGSASWKHYDGSILAFEGDVIVVTFNYRLGVYGFLFGNHGLLDQALALEWIVDNIVKFGGDPERISLFGQGSGADSITFHMASPISRDFFQGAILQSIGLFQGDIITPEVALSSARILGERVGCSSALNFSSFVSCLRSAESETLLLAATEINFKVNLFIDGHFMTEDPKVLFQKGNVSRIPILISLNSGDGNFILNKKFTSTVYNTGLTSEDVMRCIQDLVEDIPNITKESATRLFQLIQAEYFSDLSDPKSNLGHVIDMYTHFYFVSPASKFIKTYLSLEDEIYNVIFTHRPSVLQKYPNIELKAGFGEELFYVFGMLMEDGLLGEISTPEEKKLSKSTISTWTSFAFNWRPLYLSSGDKEERPIPASTALDSFFLNFSLNMTSSSVHSNLVDREAEFWEDFVPAVQSDVVFCENRSLVDDDVIGDPGSMVLTTSGYIRGVENVDVITGESYEVYLGIPYATAPVGELRWRKPVSVRPWSGVLNVTHFGPSCVQEPEPSGGMSEDCLYLNVWVPFGVARLRALEDKAPIMVFIHGGGYSSGSGSIPGLQSIALHGKVIMATFNFRLGPLGFLTTEDPLCPGNFGLWDQLLALRWLKENAASFGGDPQRILIFGHGSGAASATHLMSSVHATGLFTRVIAQSGSAFAPWALGKRGRLKAKYLAEYLGCSTESTTELLDCLREINATDLVKAPQMLKYDLGYFGPVLDWDFFTTYPDEAFRKSHMTQIQYMGGAISTEGYLKANNSKLSNQGSYLEYIKGYLKSVYYNVGAAFSAVRLKYFSGITAMDDLLEAGTMVFHDGFYAAGQEKVAEILARQGGRVYSYDWIHQPSSSTELKPVHKDDLQFTLGTILQSSVLTPEEVNFTLNIMTYWTNFAHSGNPNVPVQVPVVWSRYNVSEKQYLVLGPKVQDKERNKFRKRESWYYFWNYFMPEIDGREAYHCPSSRAPLPPFSMETTSSFATQGSTLSKALRITSSPATSSSVSVSSVTSSLVKSTSSTSSPVTVLFGCFNRTEILHMTLEEAEAAAFFLGAICFFLLLIILILFCKISSLNRFIQKRSARQTASGHLKKSSSGVSLETDPPYGDGLVNGVPVWSEYGVDNGLVEDRIGSGMDPEMADHEMADHEMADHGMADHGMADPEMDGNDEDMKKVAQELEVVQEEMEERTPASEDNNPSDKQREVDHNQI